MKKIILKMNMYALMLVVAAGLSLTGCNDNPDAFVLTAGKPTISYIRIPDILKSDSLITHAFMGTTIAIMGENMTSVKEIWFNDQPTILNTSVITSSTIIVPVPEGIPVDVTNKIYFITKDGDTVTYDFKVDVPAPVIASMNCEQLADGDIAILVGDYFLNDPNIPLEVIFPGNVKATNIISIAKKEIKVQVPVGSQRGRIDVKSLYGNGRAKFVFRDNRNVILDFDTKFGAGWRAGKVFNTDPAGITGSYVRLTGHLKNNSDWVEDDLACELWGQSAGLPEGPLFEGKPEDMVIKFEAYVVNPWKAGYLQMIFSPWNNSTNAPNGNQEMARGFWRPWEGAKDGTYQSEGWITVTIPLKQFIYNPDGSVATLKLKTENLGSLTLFVWGGGNDKLGAECDVKICIDNVRIVPQE